MIGSVTKPSHILEQGNNHGWGWGHHRSHFLHRDVMHPSLSLKHISNAQWPCRVLQENPTEQWGQLPRSANPVWSLGTPRRACDQSDWLVIAMTEFQEMVVNLGLGHLGPLWLQYGMLRRSKLLLGVGKCNSCLAKGKTNTTLQGHKLHVI